MLCAPDITLSPTPVDIFLDSGRRDHFGRLVQARVHDFHPGVAQRTRDDLGAAVMAVEPRFGHQHPNLGAHGAQDAGPFKVSVKRSLRRSSSLRPPCIRNSAGL